MIKIFLAILFGFLLNTSLRTFYNYQWNQTYKTISNKEYNESIDKFGYAKIIQDRMGYSNYIKYILIYGSFYDDKYEIQYP